MSTLELQPYKPAQCQSELNMAPPPSQRRRLNRSTVSIVNNDHRLVFNVPGIQPDVRLKVFALEFHVHSTILRTHSALFRVFLDSSEKCPASPSAQFSYDYISVVDDDGVWGLEPLSHAVWFHRPFHVWTLVSLS